MKKVEFELAEQFREGFYKLPKDGVKILGAVNAIIFSYFADKEQFVKSELIKNGKEVPSQIVFYCTISKMERELGLSKNTILKAIAFFENLGIFTYYKDSTNMKFYTIHNDKLEAFLANKGYTKKEKECAKNSSANTEPRAKNELGAGAKNELGAGAKNEPHIRTDNIIITDSIKTKKDFAEKKFDFLSYAKQIFENSLTKPNTSLDVWLEFIEIKNKTLKKNRKEITQRMIDLNFNELFKLQELGFDVTDRLKKSTAEGWQGIWFRDDDLAWKRHGGHFKNNVGHIDYVSVDEYNPLAKITKNLDDLIKENQ